MGMIQFQQIPWQMQYWGVKISIARCELWIAVDRSVSNTVSSDDDRDNDSGARDGPSDRENANQNTNK